MELKKRGFFSEKNVDDIIDEVSSDKSCLEEIIDDGNWLDFEDFFVHDFEEVMDEKNLVDDIAKTLEYVDGDLEVEGFWSIFGAAYFDLCRRKVAYKEMTDDERRKWLYDAIESTGGDSDILLANDAVRILGLVPFADSREIIARVLDCDDPAYVYTFFKHILAEVPDTYQKHQVILGLKKRRCPLVSWDDTEGTIEYIVEERKQIDIDRRVVGKRLSRAILSRYESLFRFAQCFGISEDTVDNWVEGKRFPTLGRWVAISRHLGVPLCSFFGDDVGGELPFRDFVIFLAFNYEGFVEKYGGVVCSDFLGESLVRMRELPEGRYAIAELMKRCSYPASVLGVDFCCDVRHFWLADFFRKKYSI